MSQKEFNEAIEKALNASNPREAVMIAMRLAYYFPYSASEWYLSQPMATQDNEKGGEK